MLFDNAYAPAISDPGIVFSVTSCCDVTFNGPTAIAVFLDVVAGDLLKSLPPIFTLVFCRRATVVPAREQYSRRHNCKG